MQAVPVARCAGTGCWHSNRGVPMLNCLRPEFAPLAVSQGSCLRMVKARSNVLQLSIRLARRCMQHMPKGMRGFCPHCQSLRGPPERLPSHRKTMKLKRRMTQHGTRRPLPAMRRGWSSLMVAPTLEALQRWWSSGELPAQAMTRTWRQTRSAWRGSFHWR